jgi:hypothetical protein
VTCDLNAGLTKSCAEHSLYSSQREILLEHLFTGEVMQRLWLRGIYDLEVLKPQVDDAGYDLVFETASTVRHVQLKSTKRNSSLGGVNVSLRLAFKPSGCVIIIEFDDTLVLGPFYWFGAAPVLWQLKNLGCFLSSIQYRLISNQTLRGNVECDTSVERYTMVIVPKPKDVA